MSEPKNRIPARTPHWFKLDNAGKIFPGQNTNKWSNIFRISIVLKEKIDPELLERALNETMPRFPCFNVRLRRGFFWYYFEQNTQSAPVQPDIKNPCHRVRFHENNRFLFRVYYYEKRISLELFHALSDAYGAMVLLNTLTAQYLRLKEGADIPPGFSVLNINEAATKTELEDAFSRYANSKVKAKRSGDFVYHAVGERMPAHRMNIVTGYMPLDTLLEKAHEKKVTVTELLAAVLMDVHYRKQLQEKRKQKIVSVQIPVNLRKWFPSDTLRNFSLCYNVKLNPNLGEYSFDEILRHVSTYLRHVNNPKELNSMMTTNMQLEKNPVMRVMPLFIKKAGIGMSFMLTGEKTISALISNLGRIQLPPEMDSYVDRYILMTGPGKLNGARLAAVSYGNTFAVTFANIYKENDLERGFFTSLVKLGIPVKIESNRE